MKCDQIKVFFGILSLCFLCQCGKKEVVLKRHALAQRSSEIKKEKHTSKKVCKKTFPISSLANIQPIALKSENYSDEYQPINYVSRENDSAVKVSCDRVYEAGHVQRLVEPLPVKTRGNFNVNVVGEGEYSPVKMRRNFNGM